MQDRDIQTVALIGVGTVGCGWAAFYAMKGLCARLYDVQPAVREGAVGAVTASLCTLRDLGLIGADEVEQAQGRLRLAASIEDACAGADFVHESAVETYAVKKPIFALVDRLMAPDVLIASSSSGLLISELQGVMAHPERALIAHPFNPPHLMPLVELVGGRAATAATMARAKAFFERLGKVPVILQREVPGHLANRLAAAVWREAIDLVASGTATVEDVDKALCAGPGLRWAFMGPHLTYHLGGGRGGYAHFIEHIGRAFEAYWQGMATWTSIAPAAQAAIVAGVEAEVAGRSPAELAAWRDRRLAAVLKALQG